MGLIQDNKQKRSEEWLHIDATGEISENGQGDNVKRKRMFGRGLTYMTYIGNIGFQIAIPIALFIWLGTWVDAKFSTKPLWTLICIALGFFVSILNFIQIVRDIVRNK